MVEQDHIGFDPVKWINRLLDVVEGSAFTSAQKVLIGRELIELRRKLEQMQEGDKP